MSPPRVSITATGPSAGTRRRRRRPVAPRRSRGRVRPGSPPGDQLHRLGTGRGSAQLVAREEAEAVLGVDQRRTCHPRRTRRDRLRRRAGSRRPTSGHPTPGGRQAGRELGLHAVERGGLHERGPPSLKVDLRDAGLQRHRRTRERHALGERVDHRGGEPTARAIRSRARPRSVSPRSSSGTSDIGHEELATSGRST